MPTIPKLLMRSRFTIEQRSEELSTHVG